MKNFIFLCSGLAISNSPRRSRILQAAVLISQTAHRKGVVEDRVVGGVVLNDTTASSNGTVGLQAQSLPVDTNLISI